MNNVLLWVSGLLVAALCALFAVPHLVDWNRYRGVFEEEASRMLGREVRVAGKVNLRLLPSPFVQFENIYVADGEAALGDPFIRAEGFTVWLALSPLLRGAIQANEIALQKPVLKLRLANDGGGNWQSISIGRGSLPFVPSDVSLQSMRVNDGSVLLQDVAGREMVRIDAITGEATASAIEGPYRFRADFNWYGEAREIKGATAKPEADGSARLKASVRVARTGSSYLVDGRIADFPNAPKLDGELTAKLAVAAQVNSAGTKPAARPGETTGFDFKSRIEVDTAGFRMPGISLGLEQGGRQQNVTGRAEAVWRDGRAVNFEAHSTWFDLDPLAEPGATPAQTFVDLMQTLAQALPTEGHVRGRLTGDQLNLGGETLSQARFIIERSGGGALTVRELSAALPGGSRVNAEGNLSSTDQGPAFSGSINLRGANFSRFAGWLTRAGGPALPGRGEGAFGVHGNIRLGATAVELTDARAELAGSAITGAANYGWGARREIALRLEGGQIDLSAIAPGALDRGGILQLFALVDKPDRTAGKSVARASASATDPAAMDVRLNIRAGQLKDGERTLRDVIADIAMRKGSLTVADLKFSTDAGLQFEMQGDVGDAATRPRGQLRGVVSLPNRAAAVDIGQLLELPDDIVADGSSVAAALPMRVAYDVRIGQRGERSFEGTMDGVAASARTRGALRLDAGFANWRTGAIDLSIVSEGVPLARALALVLPAGEFDSAKMDTAQLARIDVRAVGPQANAVATRFMVASDNAISLEVTGQADLTDVKSATFAGKATLSSANLGQVLAASGLKRQPALRGVGLDGVMAIAYGGGNWSIEPQAMNIGGSQVSGRLTMRPAKDLWSISGRLAASEASIAGILSPVRDGRSTAPAASGVWPDEAFSFSAVAGVKGEVRVETPALKLGPAVLARDAAFDLQFDADRLEISRFDAMVLGGPASGTLKLARASAGADMTATLRIERGQLQVLRAGEATAGKGAPGTGGITLAMSGRALSARSLVLAMAGKGEARLSGGKIAGLGPAAVAASADAVLAGKVETSGPALRQEIANRLADSALTFGAVRIPVEIADGVVKFNPFSVETAEGRAVNQTVFDLAALAADSEWRIEAKATGGKSMLPPVSVVYVGPLTGLFGREARLSIDALERELGVRKMELDVEQLERLRKLDEERSKIELERRTQLELLSPPSLPLPAQSAEPARTLQPASGPTSEGNAPPAGAAASVTGQAVEQTDQAGAVGGPGASGQPIAIQPDPRRRPSAAASPSQGAQKKGPAAVYDQLNSVSR